MKKEPALWEYYHTYCLPMLKVFIKAEYKGFCIDWDKVNEVGKTIQEKIKESLEAVRAAFHKPDLGGVPESMLNLQDKGDERWELGVGNWKIGFLNAPEPPALRATGDPPGGAAGCFRS